MNKTRRPPGMRTDIPMKHCETCGWYSEPFWKHNLRHLRANPHAFCRTIRCGRGCPVRSNHAS